MYSPQELTAMLRNLLSLITAVAVCLLASEPALFAQSDAAEQSERLRENEQGQEALRGNVQQLAASLESVLEEYSRNHLMGEERSIVEKVRNALTHLSAREMKEVIDLLQRARAVSEPGAGTKAVADAHTAQKQIAVSIQRILAEHARAQEARELARQISELADRQARNLRNGIELARMANNQQLENVAAALEAQLEVQRGEQKAIAAEIQLASQRLKKSAKAEVAGVVEAERLAAHLPRLHKVQTRAEAAEASLAAKTIPMALAEEKAVRDELRKLAHVIAPRDRGLDSLEDAERQLAEIIREQDVLKGATEELRAETDFERWIQERLEDIDPNRTLEAQFRRMTPEARRRSPELRAKFDEEQSAKGLRLAQLGDEEIDLAGKTDHFAQALSEIPAVSVAIEQASHLMQSAGQSMMQADSATASQKQAEALKLMTAAQEELRRRAAEAQLLAGDSGNRLRDLEKLRAAVENAAREEDAIAKANQPNSANQREMAQRVGQLAEKSARLAPSANAALRAAATQAENAAAALDQRQQQPARDAASEAAQQLNRAAAQIANELANAQQAADLREQAQDALKRLATLIEAEQRLDLNTAAALASGAAGKLKALAPNQGKIVKQTTEFKASLSGGMIAAVQAINDAENAMLLAGESLQKEDGPAARSAEADAIARLFDAQKAIQKAAKAAQEQLGEQFADASAMARAANRVSQAMQEVSAARQQLDNAAEMNGNEAAQNAAEAAAEAAREAEEAMRAAQNAQQLATHASNSAAAEQAATSQKRAQDAVQAARNAEQQAKEMMDQAGPAAAEHARKAADRAGQAAEAANQAANAARRSQRSSTSAEQSANASAASKAAEQAGNASDAAQRAVQAARKAQQLANVAAQASAAGAKPAQASTRSAASQLAEAAQQVTEAAAQQAGSARMQENLQQAAKQLANATAEAMQGKTASAQRSAQQAAQQLAEANGEAEGTQAGIGQPSAGNMPGQGQKGEMQGQGMQGAGRQPGQGQGSGPTKDNQQPSEGATGYQASSPEAVQRASRQAALKKSEFLGLPPRERAAIQQSINEKYPREFGPLIEQYLLNLANEPARK